MEHFILILNTSQEKNILKSVGRRNFFWRDGIFIFFRSLLKIIIKFNNILKTLSWVFRLFLQDFSYSICLLEGCIFESEMCGDSIRITYIIYSNSVEFIRLYFFLLLIGPYVGVEFVIRPIFMLNLVPNRTRL